MAKCKVFARSSAHSLSESLEGGHLYWRRPNGRSSNQMVHVGLIYLGAEIFRRTIGGTMILCCILCALAGIFHFSAKSPDLFIHDTPKQEVIKLVHVLTSCWEAFNILVPSAGTNDHEETSNESLFEVGEAEAFRDVGNRFGELGWEVDGFVLGELEFPKIAVLNPFCPGWECEVILAVETTRTLGNAGIKPFQIVGGAEHHESLIRL